MNTLISVILALLICSGCSTSYDYLTDHIEDYSACPGIGCYPLSLDKCHYEVVLERKDLLIVDIWLVDGPFDRYTISRVAVVGDYKIIERGPKSLIVKHIEQDR